MHEHTHTLAHIVLLTFQWISFFSHECAAVVVVTIITNWITVIENRILGRTGHFRNVQTGAGEFGAVLDEFARCLVEIVRFLFPNGSCHQCEYIKRTISIRILHAFKLNNNIRILSLFSGSFTGWRLPAGIVLWAPCDAAELHHWIEWNAIGYRGTNMVPGIYA